MQRTCRRLASQLKPNLQAQCVQVRVRFFSNSSIVAVSITRGSPSTGTMLFSPEELADGRAQALAENTILVSPKWLVEARAAGKEAIAIIDASWHMPAAKREPQKDWEASRIPESRRLDIDAVADKSTSLPHMLPSEDEFAKDMWSLGVTSPNHAVVLYDTVGVFSSPRAWWMLKTFGHRRVAILNGGLPRYLAEGNPKESGPAESASSVDGKLEGGWRLDKDRVRNLKQILGAATSGDLVVDARSAARFRGEAPEPRPGLLSGHMPGSRNIPFDTLLCPSPSGVPATVFKEPSEIRRVFGEAGVDVDRSKPIVTSCGSGITASVLYTGLLLAGREMGGLALYDGSWTEYGDPKINTEGKVATGAADE